MADQSATPPLPQVVGPRTSAAAICSLVFGILSFVGCMLFAPIAGIICGHTARSKIRKSGGVLVGKGIAMAGLIISYLGLAYSSLGVAFLYDMIKADRERLHQLAIKKQEIASDDGKLKITTSGFWVKRTDLNKKASLQAAYNDKDMYVMVLSESKSTVPDMTLPQHHQTTRDHMLKQLSNSSATAPVSITVDNHPALQDELSGTDRGKNIVFLHTTVDEGDSFQQILAWTMKRRWQKQNEELREATNSFHSEK